MKPTSVLVLIGGTICDDRHRLKDYGTDRFYKEENVMNDLPVEGSIEFVNAMAEQYI